MSITAKSFSAEELLHMPDDGFRYELVDGELIKMSLPGSERGAITVNITVLPAQHVKARGSALFLAQRRDPSLAGIPTRCSHLKWDLSDAGACRL
jgi:hypothetical protein